MCSAYRLEPEPTRAKFPLNDFEMYIFKTNFPLSFYFFFQRQCASVPWEVECMYYTELKTGKQMQYNV